MSAILVERCQPGHATFQPGSGQEVEYLDQRLIEEGGDRIRQSLRPLA